MKISSGLAEDIEDMTNLKGLLRQDDSTPRINLNYFRCGKRRASHPINISMQMRDQWRASRMMDGWQIQKVCHTLAIQY